MPEDQLIVDGYNVLYAWARRPGASPIPAAREALLRDLELAAATRGVHCTVVLDGRPIEDIAHASSKHLTVLFAGPHSSADAVIERLVCQSQNGGTRTGSRRELVLAVPPASRLVVVTDDRTLGTLAVGWGAACWSSAVFARWLSAAPDQPRLWKKGCF